MGGHSRSGRQQNRLSGPQNFDYSYESYMSVLPAAMSMEVCAFEQKRMSVVEGRPDQMTISEFIDGSLQRAAEIIPTLRRPKGQGQHILRVTSGAGSPDLWSSPLFSWSSN